MKTYFIITDTNGKQYVYDITEKPVSVNQTQIKSKENLDTLATILVDSQTFKVDESKLFLTKHILAVEIVTRLA